ncbi:E3 ubiquitin-protein ligase RING1-like [Oryza brachyantha]|uniref:RING-type domain-containing protein n=1 Tax=Oryza brachyantha TaxID=4533 RepID=J3N616_ORYBR|nr:E3 ubiquitin-protein ligase RING1-like [Oryza brachyantha]
MEEGTPFENLLTLLEAYQRLGGGSSDGAGDHRQGNGGGDMEVEDEESEDLVQYARFLLANRDVGHGRHHLDDEEDSGEGFDQLVAEVPPNGGDDDAAFTMGAAGEAHDHDYEDTVIVGSSSGSLLPSDDELIPPGAGSGNGDDGAHGQATADQLEWEEVRRLLRIHGGRLLFPPRAQHRLNTQSLLLGAAEFVAAHRAGKRPASAAAVAALEKRKHVGGQAAAASPSAAAQCVICMENYEVGDDLSVMPCSDKHSFHQRCLAEWLARSRLCPLCRKELTDDDDDKFAP